MSSPARALSFATGLMSGMWITCAPRSNGTPNVRLSVMQRPPILSLASTSAKRLPAAATLRAAAIPAAPAPTIAPSVSPEAAAAPPGGRALELGGARDEAAAIEWRHGFRTVDVGTLPQRERARKRESPH